MVLLSFAAFFPGCCCSRLFSLLWIFFLGGLNTKRILGKASFIDRRTVCVWPDYITDMPISAANVDTGHITGSENNILGRAARWSITFQSDFPSNWSSPRNTHIICCNHNEIWSRGKGIDRHFIQLRLNSRVHCWFSSWTVGHFPEKI